MKKIISTYGNLLFWFAVATAVFVYMQLRHSYLFPFIEQQQMFMYDGAYLMSKAVHPAGFVSLVEEFIAQFFYLPYCGAALAAVMLTGAGIITQKVVRVINPYSHAVLLWLIPVIVQMFMLLDYDYRFGGIVAYILAAAALIAYLRMTRMTRAAWAITFASVASVILFWLAGPAATSFAVAVLLDRVVVDRRNALYAALPLVLTLFVGALSVFEFHLTSDMRHALLADGYYNPMMHPAAVFHVIWIVLPLTVVAARMICTKNISPRKRALSVACQIVCAALLIPATAHTQEYYLKADTLRFRELDYYMRQNRWDDIVALGREGFTNDLHCNILNTALLRKDSLAAEAFAFRQNGIGSILIDWSDNNPFVFPLLSDMYFAAGNASIAQEVAFKKLSESLAVRHSNNPRMLMRLVETSLICGGHSGYATAEKYISLLEHSLFYRRWATAQRRFLYDDAAVESDPTLGNMRRNMPNIDIIYSLGKNFDAVQSIDGTNPYARRQIELLCVEYLLNADLTSLAEVAARCYGTPLMPSLPDAYAEALLIYSTQQPSAADAYAISPVVKKRFLDFQNFAARNYNRSDLAAVMKKSYGKTYMYYYMFIKE